MLSAVAVAASAGSALASNDFRLDLFLVARSIAGDGTLTDVGTGNINATAGQQFSIELRYRINDSNADTVGSRGLSSASIRFGTNAGANGSVSRAANTAYQEDPTTNGNVNTTPILNPDASGAGSGGTGLHGVFRGGLVGDTDPANGGSGPPTNVAGLALSQFFILPLTLSSPGQQTWLTGTSPTVANTNTNNNRWGLYSFIYTVGSNGAVFTASAVADAQSGNRFGYFERTGGTNNPIPQTSTQATDSTLAFIVPAPASVALLGLGGLVAGRRRRA